MKWIPATIEGLAQYGHTKRINAQYHKAAEVIVNDKGIWYFYTEPKSDGTLQKIQPEDWALLEILDESESPAPVDGGEKLKAALVNAQNKFDAIHKMALLEGGIEETSAKFGVFVKKKSAEGWLLIQKALEQSPAPEPAGKGELLAQTLKYIRQIAGEGSQGSLKTASENFGLIWGAAVKALDYTPSGQEPGDRKWGDVKRIRMALETLVGLRGSKDAGFGKVPTEEWNAAFEEANNALYGTE